MSRKNTKSEAALEPRNPQLPTDVEALRRAQILLVESEERLRAITETARDAIIVLEGEHGNITAWNLAAEAIFGHTQAEALGQELHHLLTPPRFHELVRSGMAHFSRSGEGGAIGKTLELVALHKDGTEFPIEISLSAMRIHGKWYATGIVRNITERQRMERERLAQLRFVESMDRINLAIQGTSDLEKMLRDVLDAVLAIFDCDRAWLIHPCDPEAVSWSVPMERTKSEYPGASVRGLEIPMDPEIQRVFRAMRASGGPVPFGPGAEHALPEWLGERFGVQSQLTLAIYPNTGRPWGFGMHQCSHARLWAPEEQHLFQSIARWLADGLTSLLAYRELQESETKYRRIVDTASEGIWAFAADMRTSFVNARMADMLGYSRAEMNGRPMTDFLFEEDAPDHLRKMQNRRQGVAESYERRFRHKNGEAVWTLASGTPIFDDAQQFKGTFGMFSDITERKRAEAAFHQVSRHNEMILEAAGEGIWGVGEDGRISFINPAALDVLGYARDELLGLNSHAVLHHSKPDDSPYPQEDCPMHQSLRGGLSIRGKEETLWRKDGSPLPVLYSSTPIREDDKIVGAVVTFQNITELKRYQTQLERQSNHDELTGLPNRNLLTDRLAYAVARCLREQTKLAVLVLNLDRFGEINDSLGRTVGDRVLRETAERLRQLVREMDMVARLAGDEFVLVGEIDEEEEAAYLARRILEALSHPFRIEEREIFVHARVGIGVLPKDGENGETLLNNALVAMYRTKATGANTILFYSAEMNAHSLEHLNLENDLRRAIERDELLLYYQPQLSLRSGEIIGMEALLRWRHPVRGLVSPMEFIPLAETTGLIVPIGEWVLRTACTQNRAWQRSGLRAVPVAVNLSARQFEAQDMVALTAKVLSETGLDPRYLELELTESVAMGDAEAFVGVTEKLKSLSVSLSIDDFGTGYSSLSYLKRFSLDRLKVDQSFVRDIIHDPDSAAIVMAVITLAHSLGLSVIAEGVETEAQLNFLRVRGCDEMQGFYFAEPLPAAEFQRMLSDGRKLSLSATGDLPQNALLLVDDEPSVLAAMKRQLRREGYPILTATSAREGLELLAIHRVAVVMSDQRMPEMTGAEFLAKVRVMYPDTVRIILSGYADLKSVTEAVNLGEFYKFLEKPWEKAALQETLREAFRHYEARRVGRDAAA